jgi:hypothetical protein
MKRIQGKRTQGPSRYRRMQEGLGNDAYRPGAKPKGPVHCPQCGAVFVRGRWSWGAAPGGAAKLRCPACRRTNEGLPAGLISLSGTFFARHRKDVLARVRSCEAQEKAGHPLERVMAITEDGEGSVRVTTTSVHLARLIGHALEHAFKGDLSRSYDREDNRLRMRWRRDD